MIVNQLWESIFNYSDYVKGAEYSASDICGDILVAKLTRLYPQTSIKYEDRISAFVGSAIHQRIEKFIDGSDVEGVESEVKLKHKNLSGTADLIIDGSIVLDFKSSQKESTMKSYIREPSKWIKQLSIYSYLLSKQRKQKMNTTGYIAWFVQENGKHGVIEYELLSEEEVVKIIKEFMTEIQKPVEELPKCDLCIQYKHRYCGVRDNCHYWNISDDFSNIDDW